MNVGELLALLRRRWAVLIPMLALTALAVVGAWTKIHTQYQSQVQMTMINAPKIVDSPGNDGNPYLAFDGTLAIDADFLARNLVSSASAQQLAGLGVTEAYTAGIASNALGPFIQLSVTGPMPQHVSQSMQTLIAFTQRRWAQLQQATSAPLDSIIGVVVIAPPGTPTRVLKRKLEAVAAVAIASLIASVLVVVIADSVIRRRVIQRQLRKTAGSERVGGETANAATTDDTIQLRKTAGSELVGDEGAYAAAIDDTIQLRSPIT